MIIRAVLFILCLSSVLNAQSSPNASAFNGPHAIPGKIQAEDFDQGGQRVAYRDLHSRPNKGDNLGGAYRLDEGVDIEVTTDGLKGYMVAWVGAREWLRYTIEDVEPGTYRLDFRLANHNADGRINIEMGGIRLGSLQVPPWHEHRYVWKTVSFDHFIQIKKPGTQVLKLIFHGKKGHNNYLFNFEWVEFVSAAEGSTSASVRDSVGTNGVESTQVPQVSQESTLSQEEATNSEGSEWDFFSDLKGVPLLSIGVVLMVVGGIILVYLFYVLMARK